MNSLGLGLNCECHFCDPAKRAFVGAIDEPRQAGVCAADAASSADHPPPLRRPQSGRVQGEVLLVPGSVPVHGVRTVDLSGEPSGHRSMPARTKLQTLSSRMRAPIETQTRGAQTCREFDAETSRCCHCGRYYDSSAQFSSPVAYKPAIASISTSASFGRRDTCTVERAGGADVKYLAYTSFMAEKSFMSFRKTVVFTT